MCTHLKLEFFFFCVLAHCNFRNISFEYILAFLVSMIMSIMENGLETKVALMIQSNYLNPLYSSWKISSSLLFTNILMTLSKNILKVGQNFQISYGPQRITVIMVDVLLQFQLPIISSMALNPSRCI